MVLVGPQAMFEGSGSSVRERDQPDRPPSYEGEAELLYQDQDNRTPRRVVGCSALSIRDQGRFLGLQRHLNERDLLVSTR
jgi:hypothetical protein